LPSTVAVVMEGVVEEEDSAEAAVRLAAVVVFAAATGVVMEVFAVDTTADMDTAALV
jgi:hypothetical protein